MPLTAIRPLSVLIGVFLVLGALYTAATPALEGPDEPWHFAYLERLASQEGLPDLRDPASEIYRRSQGPQSPLFYALAAWLAQPFDMSRWQGLLVLNPHGSIGDPSTFGNKNVYLHAPSVSREGGEAERALRSARLLSLVLGGLTVAATWSLAGLLFPMRSAVRVLASGLVAFNAQVLFLSAVLNNDPLITGLASVTLVSLLRLVGMPDRRFRSWLAAGTLIGLSSLAKLAGLALGAVAVMVLVVRWRRRPDLGDRALEAIWLGSGAVLVGGWLYARNWLLYGNPLGWEVWVPYTSRRIDPLTWTQFLSEARGTLFSFWGLFGWFNLALHPWLYQGFGLLVAAALGGLLWLLWRHRGRRAGVRAEPVLAALWLAVVGVSWLRFMRVSLAGQGRYFFPALAVIAGLLAAGLLLPLTARLARTAGKGILALTLVVALGIPYGYLWPAYHPVVTLPSGELPDGARAREARFGDAIRLLGYEVSSHLASPGEPIEVTLYWTADQPPGDNYTAFVHAYKPDGTLLAQSDSYPAHGTSPTRDWEGGVVVRDRHRLRLPEVEPLGIWLDVGLYGGEGRRLPVDGEDRVRLASLVVWPQPERQRLLDREAIFGGRLALNEVWLETASREVEVAAAWEGLGRMERDFTVFIHLLAPDGRRWAQADKMPFDAGYATSRWRRGDRALERYQLIVPEEAPSGRYELWLGVYDWTTGERLRLASGEDSLLVGSLELG